MKIRCPHCNGRKIRTYIRERVSVTVEDGNEPVARIEEADLAGHLAHCVDCSWEGIFSEFSEV